MNTIQSSWININLTYLSDFFWKKQNITFVQKKHITTTSLIYQINTYRHYTDYIYIKEIPTYTTSRICIREVHTNTETYILHQIYWRSTHNHYNVHRSYINIQSNTRLELIICLLFCHHYKTKTSSQFFNIINAKPAPRNAVTD